MVLGKLHLIFILVFCVASSYGLAQNYTHADTVRGAINNNRNWWDATYYNLRVHVDIKNKQLEGTNEITFNLTDAFSNQGEKLSMQIDLQEPMVLDSAIILNNNLSFKRDANALLIDVPLQLLTGTNTIRLVYHGKPREAVNPPWDGGLIWKKDEKNRPFVSVACQGLGASVWYPCKDHQSDEPQDGASLTVICNQELQVIGNGNQKSILPSKQYLNCHETTWQVVNPINSYNLVFYIGNYVNFSEVYKGVKKDFICNYYVLDYELAKAQKQFKQTKSMLDAFEHWFGAFPWYSDGYKLVQSPHLGMEHQSAVAYGNKFANGYLGRDLSGTGVGELWDFILVHESGHEWWGNNVTSKDIADMWVHEGFTCYSETLFTDYNFGTESGNTYVQGLRKNIKNQYPMIGDYDVNKEPKGDIYYKGANLLHTIRTIINNDSTFRNLLKFIQVKYGKGTVTSKQIEADFCSYTGLNLVPIFNQYLRGINIPELHYKVKRGKAIVWFEHCNADFAMPIRFNIGNNTYKEILVNTQKSGFSVDCTKKVFKNNLNKNYYVTWEAN